MLCGSVNKTRTKILTHKTAKGSHALMLLDKIDVKVTLKKERKVIKKLMIVGKLIILRIHLIWLFSLRAQYL